MKKSCNNNKIRRSFSEFLTCECDVPGDLTSGGCYVELRGTKAGASWSSDSQLKIFGEEYGKTVDILPNIQETMSGHEANLRHFVDVLLNKKEPMFVPQQGLDMIKILESFYKSAEEGREILL